MSTNTAYEFCLEFQRDTLNGWKTVGMDYFYITHDPSWLRDVINKEWSDMFSATHGYLNTIPEDFDNLVSDDIRTFTRDNARVVITFFRVGEP